MVAIHKNCNLAILRNAHEDVVNIISNYNRVITISSIDKVSGEDGLVKTFILISIHVIDLQAIAREGEEEHIARSCISHKPLQLLQDVDSSRLLGSVDLCRFLLPRVKVMEHADILRIEAQVLLQAFGYQEGIIHRAG
jgi:hypothetical protein